MSRTVAELTPEERTTYAANLARSLPHDARPVPGIAAYRLTVASIRREVETLDNAARHLPDVMQMVADGGDDTWLARDAAAWNLFRMSAGLERIFRRVSEEIDRGLPSNEERLDWLLRDVSQQRLDIRPPVISRASRDALLNQYWFWDELREPSRYEEEVLLASGVSRFLESYARIRGEVMAFAEWLERTADAAAD